MSRHRRSKQDSSKVQLMAAGQRDACYVSTAMFLTGSAHQSINLHSVSLESHPRSQQTIRRCKGAKVQGVC